MPGLLVEAARCWRTARDRGEPVQPCLFGMLTPHGYGMLAPVLDSVMTLWEAALGRDLDTGQRDGTLPQNLSADEHVLLGLFGDAQPRAMCAECGDEMARLFDCALCSARIMMEQVVGKGDALPLPGAAAT